MEKYHKGLYVLCVMILSITGLLCFAVSLLPYENVKGMIDYFSWDRDVASFTVDSYGQLRIIGIALLSAGVFFYMVKEKAARYISDTVTSLCMLLNDLVANVKNDLKEEDKIHLYTFYLILLAAVGIRLFYLFAPFRHDEDMALIFYGQGLRPLTYYFPGNHVFHSIMVKIVYTLVGSERWMWVIRLPALLFGVALVPTVYMVIRRFYDKHAALLTAAVVAFSSKLVSYSANARGYTLVFLIFFLILALGSYLRKEENSAGWLLFAVLSAIGFSTIPIMLYPYGIVVSWLFLSILVKDSTVRRGYILKRLVLSGVVAMVLTFLFYSPVIIWGSGFTSIVANHVVYPLSWDEFIREFPRSLPFVWKLWHTSTPTVIEIIFACGFLVSLVFHRRLSSHRIPVILAAVIWLLPVFLIHKVVPLHRAWLYLFPLYIGTASAGVIYLLRFFDRYPIRVKTVVVALLSIILSASLVVSKVRSEPYFPYESQYENIDKESGEYIPFRHITRWLRVRMNPGDAVLPLFSSSRVTVFWRNRLGVYWRELHVDHFSKYLVSDLAVHAEKRDGNSCDLLWIISNESQADLEGLLIERGLTHPEYGCPQLVHRFRAAGVYRLRPKACGAV